MTITERPQILVEESLNNIHLMQSLKYCIAQISLWETSKVVVEVFYHLTTINNRITIEYRKKCRTDMEVKSGCWKNIANRRSLVTTVAINLIHLGYENRLWTKRKNHILMLIKH